MVAKLATNHPLITHHQATTDPRLALVRAGHRYTRVTKKGAGNFIPLRTYVWRYTYLLRDLPKVIDESDGGVLLERVVDAVDVYVTFIEEMMEDIVSFCRLLALLLVTKDQINPLVEMGTDVVALQGLKSGGRNQGNGLGFVVSGPFKKELNNA